MGFSTFSHSKISGISFIVPKDEISIDDEIEYYDNNPKKIERIKKMIGINTRRVASEGVTAADLCQQAAENLFSGMNVDPQSIDCLIFISQSPDHAIPATACILQDKLGLSKNCAAFDVNQGCTAYTYGLWLASSMIDSRACKKVLVLVGEAGARYNNPANRVITPIFGDSGCATLIEYSENEIVSHFAIGTDGSGAEALMIPAGHGRCVHTRSTDDFAKLVEPIVDSTNNPWTLIDTYMDGGAIFDFTLTVVPPHILELLEYAKESSEDIDYLILHQANKQIAQMLAVKAGFPLEKAPTETVSKYGNQAGASLAGVVCDQLTNFVSENKAHVLLSGFGVGLSWASAIIDLDHIWCSGIVEYNVPNTIVSRADYIQYWKDKILETIKN